jgi:microsomal dipeptidase-like Zn-dependent dipeptidase
MKKILLFSCLLMILVSNVLIAQQVKDQPTLRQTAPDPTTGTTPKNQQNVYVKRKIQLDLQKDKSFNYNPLFVANFRNNVKITYLMANGTPQAVSNTPPDPINKNGKITGFSFDATFEYSWSATQMTASSGAAWQQTIKIDVEAPVGQYGNYGSTTTSITLDATQPVIIIQLLPSLSCYTRLTSVARNNNCIDLFGIQADGSVVTTWWNQSVDQFSSFSLVGAGNASLEGGITAQSRYEGTVEVWWIGQDGIVNGAYWYAGNNWQAYKLDPSKGFAKAALKGGISSFHRTRDELSVAWIAEDGSIQGAYWGGGNWLPVKFAPSGSASTEGDITAFSRKSDSEDMWWIAPNGSISGRYSYGGSVGIYTVPNSGNGGIKASIDGQLTSVSQPLYLSVFWISAKGEVRQAYSDRTPGASVLWQTHTQPIAKNALPNGSISALMRIPTSAEVWYSGKDGGVKAAYYYEGQNWWNEYDISTWMYKTTAITALSRMPSSLEVFYGYKNVVLPGFEKIYASNFYEDIGVWTRQYVTQFKPRKMLWGFADLHAHPMANLAFGGKFLHGAPDIGSLMPVTDDCRTQVRAPNIQVALSNCMGTHGGLNLHDPFNINKCGDELRDIILKPYEVGNQAQSKHDKDVGGASTMFKEWPAWNDISHQTMWVDWIRRTYENGLRVMVALAVNNQTTAAMFSGPGDGPNDDKGSADLQIDEIKAFVGRHNDFMKVARSPDDVRSIVSEGKLAIIIGVEVDNIGNFNALVKAGQAVTEKMVATEIQRLYDKDVRYVFPIHVTDNPFGGAALYNDNFVMSNIREFGDCFQLDGTQPEDGIEYHYKNPVSALIWAGSIVKTGIIFSNYTCLNQNPFPSNKNRKGLTDLGKFALKELMKRGMMIDVDHMSQNAVNESFKIAQSFPTWYPLNSGHNDLREDAESIQRAENKRTREQYRTIIKTGGMLGIGWNSDAVGFANSYKSIMTEAGFRNCGLGTDMNGLVKAPKPRYADSHVVYDNNFKQCCTEIDYGFTKSKRCWDYNNEGVAHYGLIPDFLKDVQNVGGDQIITTLYHSAEEFAEMWGRCVRVSQQVR